jgi:hypothetical protein
MFADLSGLNPGYAETQYRFHLPWTPQYLFSPLIFVDAAHLVQPAMRPFIWIGVKNAHQFPIRLNSVEITLRSRQKRNMKFIIPIEQDLFEPLEFIPIELDYLWDPGEYRLNSKITYTLKKNKKELICLNWNYRATPGPATEIKVLEQPNPCDPDWISGDFSCYSEYSGNPFTFGAPPHIMQMAAYNLGLNYVVLSDHSYSFTHRLNNVNQRIDPDIQWLEYRERCHSLLDAELPLIIPGEEVSCGNAQRENVRMLVCNHPFHIPGTGDHPAQILRKSPEHYFKAIIDDVQGAPCIPVNPCKGLFRLDKNLHNAGNWSEADMDARFKSILIWQGTRDQDFKNNYAFWAKLLRQGTHITPLGGSGAYGDLNTSTKFRLPFFKMEVNRNNLLGKVRTFLKGKAYSQKTFFDALKNGESCVSEGPFLKLIQTGTDVVTIIAHSTIDFGKILKVNLYTALPGGNTESMESIFIQRFEAEREALIPPGAAYIRAELITDRKKNAITSALWLMDEDCAKNESIHTEE